MLSERLVKVSFIFLLRLEVLRKLTKESATVSKLSNDRMSYPLKILNEIRICSDVHDIQETKHTQYNLKVIKMK